jgi:EAL domain-containing protein (putative c-di-GMP-specific phosphodiesterase class I)
VLGRSAEALRVAKQERNRVRLYTEDLADQNVRRVQMEQRLRKAIDDHAMVFHYQPIVDLRSGRIMGLEALARWEDPELGFVSPTDFVPIAEQTGLIHDLGRMAIESALRVMVNGAVAVSPVGYVAVNVSPLQLRRPQFVQEVSDMVIDLRATPSMLKLEVTEGIFMDTDDPAVENLRRLADLGIGIAIDDFGSGYSSLGYMSRLPVETVKVDRLLTSQVDDARTRSVVKALVWVAEAHGLQVILEGVENEQTAATLRRLGVRWGQGWLFSRAVPESDLPEVLDLLGTVPISHRFSQSNLARLTSPGRQRTRIG